MLLIKFRCDNQLYLGIIASGIDFTLRPANVFLCESVVLT